MPDVVIAGVTYPDVPAIDMATTDSSSVRFYDVNQISPSDIGAIAAPSNPNDGQLLVYSTTGDVWRPGDLSQELAVTNSSIYYITADPNNSSSFVIDCNINTVAAEIESERKVTFIYVTSPPVICYLTEFDTSNGYLYLHGLRFNGLEELNFYFTPASSDPADGFVGTISTFHHDNILTEEESKNIAAVVEVNGNTIITNLDGEPVSFTELMDAFIKVKNLEIGFPNTSVYDASVGRIIDYNYSTSTVRISVLTTYNDLILTFQEINDILTLTNTFTRPLDCIEQPGSPSTGDFLVYNNGGWTAATPSAADVGLGNVDNVQQYSASNPPPYPVTSVNGETGTVVLNIPTKTSDLTNDSNYMSGMTILSYGHSTWAEVLAAYNARHVVYCRASSGTNPASGAQTRMAFMAYINADPPTNIEFQYYRSVNAHSDSQQGDQMYVYKIDSSGKWTVTVRESYSKIAVSTGLSKTYSNGTITLSSTVTGLPAVTSDDNGKILKVVDGAWALVDP